MVDPVSTFLDRLDGVRGRDGKWVAKCPAHEDRSPSLSIGVGDDGRVLINCYAGCGAAEVVGAVGLGLSDLFVDEIRERRYDRRPRVDYRGLLFHLRHEVYVLSVAATKMKKGEQFNDDDWATLDRVIKSFERLANVG